MENQNYPYPSEKDKVMLIKKTGLTRKQLRIWMINARKVNILPNISFSVPTFTLDNKSMNKINSPRFDCLPKH